MELSARRLPALALLALAALALPTARALDCDQSDYRAIDGLRATVDRDGLAVEWWAERGEELRLKFAIDSGTPVIRELAARRGSGSWRTLAANLKPEFHVSAGRRRISYQQINPAKELGIEITPEWIEKEKWKVFWDAPLSIPGLEGVNPDLPRGPEEVRRTTAVYRASGCEVKTEGVRLVISFDGLEMVPFAGRLQYTVYRGSNLIRQEAVARTDEPSVAYKYRAGLAGFSTADARRVVWRDTSRAWQNYEFGGSPNEDPVPLRARNRLALVETSTGAIAVFPPPHKFFFAREIERNLGYVWYRKDSAGSFSVGVRHADREEMFAPYGVSGELWEKRVRQSRRFALGNFALYNAPPGTWQRMAVYFYPSLDGPRETQQRALAYTRGDRYAPLPGYQVAVSHFHTHFGEQLSDAGSLDMRPPWLVAFRALGINIAMMSDFHGDGHPNDPGPVRFRELNTYFEACRRHSDKEFLLMPGEEPNVHIGGHYTLVFPKPVYWTKVRQDGQPFTENSSEYGKVYHTGNSEDMLRLLEQERGLIWQSHPRTKGSTPYPDAIRDTERFRSDRYLGGAFQSLPVDLSEARICEQRCFGTLDDMNNWAGPKYLFAEGDTYTKYPEDEIYGELAVNYIRVEKLPLFDEDWSPITGAIRRGDYFVTTGEVLIPEFRMEGSGNERRLIAEVDWTFPLEFVEVVWGDGKSTGREILSQAGEPPLQRKRFEIPFDAAGKKWVRFAAWDTAGNGAFVQPVHLQ